MAKYMSDSAGMELSAVTGTCLGVMVFGISSSFCIDFLSFCRSSGGFCHVPSPTASLGQKDRVWLNQALPPCGETRTISSAAFDAPHVSLWSAPTRPPEAADRG